MYFLLDQLLYDFAVRASQITVGISQLKDQHWQFIFIPLQHHNQGVIIPSTQYVSWDMTPKAMSFFTLERRCIPAGWGFVIGGAGYKGMKPYIKSCVSMYYFQTTKQLPSSLIIFGEFLFSLSLASPKKVVRKVQNL